MKQYWVGEVFIHKELRGGFASELGRSEAVCGLALTSHLPHGVGGITGAVLVTDEAVEALGTESLLAIRAFKPCFTQTGSVDMVTLGSVLTLAPLVTLRTKGAHRTVILTPGGRVHCLLNWWFKKYIKRMRVKSGHMKFKCERLKQLCTHDTLKTLELKQLVDEVLDWINSNRNTVFLHLF